MFDTGVFEFGPFRLDAGKAVVWRGGELVPLTPKALAVLIALAEHGGDVVSKQELVGRVWPVTVVSDSNLSVTVSALRRQLGPQPDGRPYVETVHGRGYRFAAPVRGVGAPRRLALAVLPFAALGPEVEPHLGLGLADALIGRLTRIEELLVRPTEAVAGHAGSKTARETAAELGVDAVVTGTVQRHMGRLRLSVQLVPRPASLRPWADSFDADWTDLFAVQDLLADRLAAALWPRLASGAHAPAGVRHRPGPDAYDAYLRGRYFWARLDSPGVSKAIGCFAEAASLDDAWAAPRAGLADAHVLLGFGGVVPPRQAWKLAAECVAEALERDPGLPEAQVSKARLALYRDWDWAEARRLLAQAASACPGVAAPRQFKALLHALLGELEPARRELAVAREADPLSGLALALQSFLHDLAGERQAELMVARRAVELRGERPLGHWRLAVACARLGHGEEALAALRRAVLLSEEGTIMRCMLAWTLARLERSDEAASLLAELDAAQAGTYVSPYHRARVLVALGQRDAALERLEQAAEERDAWVVFLGVDDALAPLRETARYAALKERVFARR